MNLDEFRERVLRTFGEDLHRASPASVRDFVDRLSLESPAGVGVDGKRFVIDESARSYEEVMRTFFARVLEMPEERAVMLLWAVALDLSYAVIASHETERLDALFRGLEEPSTD